MENSTNNFSTAPVPLVYSRDVPVSDYSKYTNLLLIDSAVAGYQDFVNSANTDTFPVVYSVFSTREEVLSLISSGFSNLKRIGVVFETNDNGRVYPFLNGEDWFTNSDAQGVEPFSENMQFIIGLIQTFGITNIDYLACNTLCFDNWKNYYAILLAKTGVVVGASSDKTGNIKYGGDWVLESTEEDVEKVYFTNLIEYHTYLLVTAYSYGNTVTGNTTVSTNSIDTALNTVLYQVTSNIGTFTNNAILLGGGGGGIISPTAYDGAHALMINSSITVTNLINNGSLTGGGGGGAGNGPNRGGHGGAGGGGGGGASGVGTAGVGGVGGGGSSPNAEFRASFPGGESCGGGGGFGGLGGERRDAITGAGANGGNGATASSIFSSAAGANGGGGGAGGGKGGLRAGGGSGGGLAGTRDGSMGGNGGFGIQNLGTITNLYNAQNLSGYYGPLYMAGTAPTKYYITILGDTSYGQLFASPNDTSSNGLGLNGNIDFNIDPSSVLTIGMKNYTYVLSDVSLNKFTGTGTWQNKSYTWTLNKNARTMDNNGITISNYDLSLNLIVPGIDISLSTFNRSKLVVDSSTNIPNVYSPFDVSYGTTDISLSYAKADASTILDLSVNTTSYVDIATPFNISELESGDNSLNFTLYSSDRSSNVPYFVKVHVQTSNQFSTLTLYDQPVTFDASYSARLEVPYDTDDISGQYILVDPSANVDLSVNNVRQQRGMSSPFDVSGLVVGDNSLNFMVTAYDKQTKQPYFVKVYMQTANTIKTLFLNKNQINLTNPSLRIDVSNGINDISGSYYLEDTRATVDISVNTDYSRYSIAASFDVPQLVTGDNALNLMVTAYDKKTVKNYPINVHVQTSNRFSNLYLNNQRIVFDNSFVGTRIDVSYSAYGITGDYYTVDPGTTVDVSVNTTYYTASDIDPSFNVGLQPKDNSLNFMVTSSDKTKQAYLAKVYMQTSTDFATLTLNSTLINWVVDSNGNNIGYLGVSFGIKDISGSYSLVDTLAKVDMSVNNVSFPNISSSSFNINNLQKGQNNVYFYVKSSDGFTKKIYYVNIGVQSTLFVSKLLIKPNGRVNFTTKNGSGKLTFMI